MDKPALTKYNIHPLLNKRWSPRSFADKPIPKESLQRIFEAARWAPSSFNEQPWRFIVGIKGDKTWDKIFQTLVEFNQKWAQNAPLLILNIGKTTTTKNGKTNATFKYDTGQSVAYITIQAMHEGIFSHQMGGFDNKKASEKFQIPEDFQPLSVIALGYKADPTQLDEEFRKMEIADRQRKKHEEIIFTDNFGKSPDWM